MLAYAMHLLRTQGARDVRIHPDGEHGKQFDFASWLLRREFAAALAELQAGAVSIASLVVSGKLGLQTARSGVVALLAAAGLAKSVLAFLSGGPAYALRVGAGLALMVAAAATVSGLLPVA